MTTPLRFRQIHLDFHTSPAIDGVGADFDADEFADTLAKASVDSVTCFARCHHGHIYYDSKAHPERVHPHLKNKNLLAEQIEACHERGIRVPIYTTIQWDALTADEHRDWLHVDEKGNEFGTPPLAPGFYRFLDVFHPGYRAFLRAHLEEILTTLPVDGLFLDIVQARPSLARHWLDAMDDAGHDPSDANARQAFAVKVINDWKLETTAFIRQFNEDCTIFYNAGHVGPRHRATRDAYSHYELESLPSGGWGYMHFPQTMRYARGLGKECLGMTGKFHTSWGDFHSFKNAAALEFECFHMLALGARCSVGDQLHPSGKIDPHTYDLIGGVYGQVAKKEPWCTNATPVCELGVLTPEEFADSRPAFNAKSERDQPAMMGAVRMLQELRIQFDVVDSQRDFSPYKAIVLPDEIPVASVLAKKLEDYVAGGGKVIASYHSGLVNDGRAFATSMFGVALKGDAPFSPDFIVPTDKIPTGLPPTGHVMYLKGLEVMPRSGAEVLCSVEVPYFNRTYKHYCSHRHTPSAGKPGYPAVVRNGNCIYFAHPVFSQYQQNAPRWCKQLVAGALDLLLESRAVVVDGPSSLLATLNEQADEGRRVLHLLHYIPERRGAAFDVIEDVIPLYDVKCDVASPTKVASVALQPEGKELKFKQKKGRVTFVVPEVSGHAMVELAVEK